MTPFALLADLATCLCAQIKADGLPDTCFCGVFPGSAASDQYAGDCEQNGMAWVRLASAYPANGVAEPVIQPGNCALGLGLDIEIGIMRCTPVGDDLGNPPTVDQLLAAAEAQMAEMITMQRAILCCSAIPNKDVLLTTYEPQGPEGGLIGGTWVISTVL